MKNRGALHGTAFTLTELLVVIAVIALLAGALLPTLIRAKDKGHETACLSNHRQLALTWLLYATENQERLALNGFAHDRGRTDLKLWVQGHLNLGIYPPDITNSALVIDPKFALFALYIGKGATRVYRCPADRTEVVVYGNRHKQFRSVALNGNLGWDMQTGSNPWKKTATLTSHVGHPASTLTFIDVYPNSLCWPFFGILPKPKESFHMLPGLFHQMGSALSFADGHAAIKRWKDPRTYHPPNLSLENWHNHDYASPENPDLAWLRSVAGGQ